MRQKKKKGKRHAGTYVLLLLRSGRVVQGPRCRQAQNCRAYILTMESVCVRGGKGTRRIKDV